MDVDEFIRTRLRQAREDAQLSQAEVGERFGATQVTISDLERGRTRANAADLFRLAGVLGKPVTYFLPIEEESDLAGDELRLLTVFREFSPKWREAVLTSVESQLDLYRMTRDEESAREEILALPEPEREEAAYQRVTAWLDPLVRKGLRIIVEGGRAYIGHKNLKRIKIPYPLEDEKELGLILELQLRLAAEQDSEVPDD